MLVFSTEEAWWILDITHDYLQMIMHTKNQAEEMRKWYESMLAPDAQLPEGITAKQIAEDLESLKQDAIHLDIAEKRTTTIRDAARDFIMSDTPENEWNTADAEYTEPSEPSTESESEWPSEANVAVTE